MSADPNRNRNVEWLRTPFLLPLYVVFIALFFGVVHGTSLLSTGGSWAVTNAAHGLITFIVFHWWKVRSICALSHPFSSRASEAMWRSRFVRRG